MGTNFYRIPTSSEMNERNQKLTRRLQELDLWNPSMAFNEFRFIDNPEDEWSKMNPWDEFVKDSSIHLGKRSGGWKFSWNFHNNKYYSNKEELFKFIRSGRIVDEYGVQIDCEEFIKMTLEWCQDGWDTQTYYEQNPTTNYIDYSKYHDTYVDGLRVSSSTDFS